MVCYVNRGWNINRFEGEFLRICIYIFKILSEKEVRRIEIAASIKTQNAMFIC